MARQFIMAAAVYLVGGLVLVIWSLSGFAAGAPREDWALMIVLPLAWIFSFWPAYGSISMIVRIHSVGATLERVAQDLRAGNSPGTEGQRELEELATQLIARENRLPEALVRPFVRRGIAHAVERAKARAQ